MKCSIQSCVGFWITRPKYFRHTLFEFWRQIKISKIWQSFFCIKDSTFSLYFLENTSEIKVYKTEMQWWRLMGRFYVSVTATTIAKAKSGAWQQWFIKDLTHWKHKPKMWVKECHFHSLKRPWRKNVTSQPRVINANVGWFKNQILRRF